MAKKPTTPSLLDELSQRKTLLGDAARPEATAKRHAKGYRTARENLADLVDLKGFVEYGDMAVAAQRSRRSLEELQQSTPADGVITGIGRVNASLFGDLGSETAIIVNDYSVLAGTQGYFHHRKIDRILDIAERRGLPVVMFAEGGGGRPGDTDIMTNMAGLDVPTFYRWSRLAGRVPRIAVVNGYCFAGNAALFGSADLCIATENSWIGMAGPAMIEGGGLGQFKPTDIGPASVQRDNGVIDVLVSDEAEATAVAKQALSLAQGGISEWDCNDQTALRTALPENRRMAYDPRRVIDVIVDKQSLIECRPRYGRAVITALARIGGLPVALLVSDCRHLGGAIDTEASRKCTEFLELAKRWQLPIVSLIDTPGFMVGPDSEAEGAARAMPALFNAAASIDAPWAAIFLRRGYGLGAMALAGGSFDVPNIAASWPQGEFGGMGLEGAVKLGFKRELDILPEGPARDARFEELVERLYQQGKATEAASYLELDTVIDPATTRDVILQAIS